MRDLSSTFARWEEGFWWGEEWDFEGFGVGFEEEDDDIVRRKKERERFGWNGVEEGMEEEEGILKCGEEMGSGAEIE